MTSRPARLTAVGDPEPDPTPSRSTRAVEITDTGSLGLRDIFDIDLTEPPPNLPIETASSRIR
jgi:hypothetical protein